jgi:hypothetical protein
MTFDSRSGDSQGSFIQVIIRVVTLATLPRTRISGVWAAKQLFYLFLAVRDRIKPQPSLSISAHSAPHSRRRRC